jgi:DNA polymerase delta subunit 1
LPTVLEDLISARKRAKADLKKETDPFRRAVLDGRQLALKVYFPENICNNRYCLTVLTDQCKFCLRIYWRYHWKIALPTDLIQRDCVWTADDRKDKTSERNLYFVCPLYPSNMTSSIQEVEAEYCISNGHAHNAEVIYGDTDSVMVKFGPNDLTKVMTLGEYKFTCIQIAATHSLPSYRQ